MKRNYIFPFVLSFAVVVFMASALKAAQAAAPPLSYRALAAQEDAQTRAALKPLREKMLADREALKEAQKAGDKDKIAAARKTIGEDFKAIREKMAELKKTHRP